MRASITVGDGGIAGDDAATNVADDLRVRLRPERQEHHGHGRPR